MAALEFEGVKPHLLLNTGLLTATLLRGEEEVVQVQQAYSSRGSDVALGYGPTCATDDMPRAAQYNAHEFGIPCGMQQTTCNRHHRTYAYGR